MVRVLFFSIPCAIYKNSDEIFIAVVILDPCFAEECKDCAAKPDDSTTCGKFLTRYF